MSSPGQSSDQVVSVVVPTRNRADLLRRCLESLAAQTHHAVEVLVVDDGSDEPTRARYATLCPTLGARLRWVLPAHPHAPATGPAAARNRALRIATGAFVAFCDDDDHWIARDHLAIAVRALNESGADFYFTNVVAADAGEKSEKYKFFPEANRLEQGMPVVRDPKVFAPSLQTVMQVVGGTVIHPDVWVVRRSLLNEAGEFWERLWFAEDYNLMMRVLDRAGTILFRPDSCAEYQVPVAGAHSLSTSVLERYLQEILAAQHARALCRQPVLRRHARAREAWQLRQLARRVRADGHSAEARWFAWQGLCTRPTLAAVRDLFWGTSPLGQENSRESFGAQRVSGRAPASSGRS